ncbi:MAG: glycosyltransferase [Planctomycetota bacterium]|jgi:glycosyltransferase involved in cell wall biosynthesis
MTEANGAEQRRSDVVVLLPVYNRPRLIVEWLDNIAAQTLSPDAVILVDDCSTDDTPEVMRAWIAERGEENRFRLGRRESRGRCAGARNLALRMAPESRFLAIPDSDDLWPEDFIERTSAILSANPDAVAATTDIQIVHRGGKSRTRDLRDIKHRITEELFRDAGIGMATLYRSDAVRTCKGWDESLLNGEDIPFQLRVSGLGRWCHAPGAPCIKRHGFEAPEEEGNNHHTFDYRQTLWAEVYEDFVKNHGDELVVDQGAAARLMAARWIRTGKALARGGDPQEARACYRRALAWRPASLRARWKLARTFLPV